MFKIVIFEEPKSDNSKHSGHLLMYSLYDGKYQLTALNDIQNKAYQALRIPISSFLHGLDVTFENPFWGKVNCI